MHFIVLLKPKHLIYAVILIAIGLAYAHDALGFLQ